MEEKLPDTKDALRATKIITSVLIEPANHRANGVVIIQLIEEAFGVDWNEVVEKLIAFDEANPSISAERNLAIRR